MSNLEETALSESAGGGGDPRKHCKVPKTGRGQRKKVGEKNNAGDRRLNAQPSRAAFLGTCGVLWQVFGVRGSGVLPKGGELCGKAVELGDHAATKDVGGPQAP